MFKISPQKWLIFILALAFLIRIAGVSYGLPLWLIGDEPPFVAAALKMLELKTVLPVLHQNEFQPTLYFPPYLSYIYLIPFLAVLGFKLLFFTGTLADFKNFLLLDTSAFFLVARFLSALLGVSTIYIVYKIGLNIFKNKKAALLSATFLSLSLLHIIFSHWARHWTISLFIFSLVLYFLSHPFYSKAKRYFIASFICGIGAGMLLEITLIPSFIVFWFFFYDKLSLSKELKTKWLWSCIFIFFVIFALAYLVWPEGAYLMKTKNDTVAVFVKIIDSLKYGYTFYFFDFFKRETSMACLSLVGLTIGYFKFRRYFVPIILSILFYIFIFYYVFSDLNRLFLLLYPLLALSFVSPSVGVSISGFSSILGTRGLTSISPL